MKTAFLFPGQGAQVVGMGKDFYDSFPLAKEIFQEADDLLNEKLSQIIFEGPTDLLTQTKNSQLAIFVTSMALLRVVQSQLPDLAPNVCAGLSLGEYTALCASGRLPFKETLLLVQQRARLMNEACEKVPGTMAAVLGMSAEEIVEGIKGLEGVWVANFNAPGQTVISGTRAGIEKATIVLKEKGAKRVLPLSVHGAFHSGLMQVAQDGLKPFIEKAPLQKSNIDFVMNVPGAFVTDEANLRQFLISQVTQSVKWEQGIYAMKEAGIQLFLEIGCGKTLTGLNRKMDVPIMASVEKIEDLEKVHAATKGKKALITGGTAGIGKAIASLYAQHGADVAILGTNQERGAEVLKELEACRTSPEQKFACHLANVSNSKEIEETVDTILKDWGKIDILVNNAGITRDNLLMKMSEEDWDIVMDVNLKSVYNTCKALSRPMMKARGGTIINITSVIGLTGNAGQVNYAASKSGMIGFTKSLAKELASRGIRANCIAPGYIETQMTTNLSPPVKEAILAKIPMSRIGNPLDIAQAALFLASDMAGYITGQVLTVDGGMVM